MAGDIRARQREGWRRTDLVCHLLEGDWTGPAIFEAVTEQIEVELPGSLPVGGRHQGRRALGSLIEEFRRAFELHGPLRHVVSELGGEEVMVWTTGTVRSRATDRPLEIDVRSVVGFVETDQAIRVASVRCFWRDTAAALVALGVWASWS